ncbi:MAG: hypothetical protein CVU08_14460 [Bacteroidetes bacterium HGW-Bacteroidetes-3]|nr:MAG: hypothetical protein CVU08_14460 [Bacteroidetes bacterium HGW-Bacteroidetes-3]
MEAISVELDNIKKKQIENSGEDDPLFTPPKVVDVKTSNNRSMIIYLDKVVNNIWKEVFYNQKYINSKSNYEFSPKELRYYNTLNERAAFEIELYLFSEDILRKILILLLVLETIFFFAIINKIG